MNIKLDLGKLLDLVPALRLAALFGAGEKARDTTERAITIPEAKVRAACKGMTEADTVQAVGCFRRAADELSDGLALIASKGEIQPD